MGDRIVVMKDGRIQQVATPLDLYDRPTNRFVAGFIGSPPMNFFEGALGTGAGGLVFREAGDGFAAPVPAALTEAMAPYAGRSVVFGIRPEDMKEPGRADGFDPGHKLTARVEVLEPMGAEVHVYLHTGHHSCIARMDPHCDVQVGQDCTLVLNLAKAHFFDAESGQAIAS